MAGNVAFVIHAFAFGSSAATGLFGGPASLRAGSQGRELSTNKQAGSAIPPYRGSTPYRVPATGREWNRYFRSRL